MNGKSTEANKRIRVLSVAVDMARTHGRDGSPFRIQSSECLVGPFDETSFRQGVLVEQKRELIGADKRLLQANILGMRYTEVPLQTDKSHSDMSGNLRRRLLDIAAAVVDYYRLDGFAL